MTTSAVNRPVEVLFSQRALAAICAETLDHHPNETGGILLGHFHQDRWQVLEAIDPGPGAVSTEATFSYDQAYVTHLAAKLARQYRQYLHVIGLWHRHPGCFDRFSADDDTTNQRFAVRSCHGALSCLVNLDPQFRITAYHVPADLHYQRLPVWIGDGLIAAELRASLDASDLDSEQLLSNALNRNLQTLLARQPRAASPLQGPVATAIDGLLERLDQQEQWRYGLRPCGEMLQVALIERDGPKRQLWELQAGGNGQITATLVEPLHHGS